MLAVIIGIIVFIISVTLIVFACICDKNGPFAVGVVMFFIICFMLPVSLIAGRSIYKRNNTEMLVKREQIKYLLKNNTSIYVIEQAQYYNNEVDFGNNLWCRFSIEDRSEYKIDIDKYIKVLEDEQNK